MNSKRIENKHLTPFIRWVGGKGQSIKEIVPMFQSYRYRYWEPMIGGGSLFLWTKPFTAVISDINPELVNLWKVVKYHPTELIKELEKHKRNHGEEYYYKVREMLNQVKLTENNPPNIKNAGMFLYLNKAGFNGLYRENGKGLINVPYGHKTSIALFTKQNITEISEYLQTGNIEIVCQNYWEIKPQQGDFVYLDPPYDETYGGYNSESFSQEKLKEFCDELDKMKVKWLQTNNNTEKIQQLYKNYHIRTITVNAVINSNGEERKDCRQDLIITNYGEEIKKARKNNG